MRASLGSFWVKCLVGALSVGAWASVANAQNTRDMVATQAGGANAQNTRDMVAPDKKAESEAREAAAESIVAREEAATGRAFDPGFRAEVLKKLASRTLSELESLQSQSGAGLGILPEAFGSSQADLVYTPVTPCRIIDTRAAGGPLAAGFQRSFFVAGTAGFATQGGNSGGCGIPSGPATAAVINFVAVNAAGAGDLRITPFGTAIPLASIINYAAVPGLNIANGPVVKICDPASTTCTFDITIQADVSGTDLVADVQGFFSLLPSTLASGRALQGNWAVTTVASAAGQDISLGITFSPPLANGPAAADANYITGSSTTNCPGSVTNPTAAAGQFCMYERASVNATHNSCGFFGAGPSFICNVGDPFGILSTWSSSASGVVILEGTWAVTAP